MYVSNDGKWYTYGVTSMVFADRETKFCNSKEPSYFTRVSAYLEWIEDAMEFLQKN
jgi:ribosomal protein L24E